MLGLIFQQQMQAVLNSTPTASRVYGDYFINGGKGSMFGKKVHPIFTTIGAYAIIGTGIIFKSLSNKNYDLYHNSTNQSDIDKYYDLANSQNKTAWSIIGIGGVVWLADIIWVIKKGLDNNKIERDTRTKLNITFVPSYNNTFAFGLIYNL